VSRQTDVVCTETGRFTIGVTVRDERGVELGKATVPFDVVISQQMLQFVSDPAAALREMRRVLRPGGRVGISVCRAIAHSDPRSRNGNGRRAPTLGAFQLLPRGGNYGVTLADMATSSLPEAVERMEEVERYAPGIRPIRVSFAMLWNALWRSIPGLGSSESDPKAWHGRMDVRRLV
jgi:SAM-dependent methyltransferase